MTKLAGSGTQLSQAEYDFKIDVVTEPRDLKQPAVSLKNATDQSDAFGVLDAYGVGLGDATADLNATGQLTFYYEYDQPVKTSNGTLTLSGGTNGQTDQLVIELRKVGLDIYGRLTKAPDLPKDFFSLDDFIGKWIHLGGAEVSADLFDLEKPEDLNFRNQIDEIRRITNIANRTKVIRSVKRLGQQDIGGTTTDHISFAIDGTKIEPLIQAIIKDMKERGKATGALEEALKDLQKNQDSVKQYFDASSFELWIDSNTGMLRQFVTTTLSERSSSKQTRVTARMTLSKLNQKIIVEQPAGAVELEDLFQAAFTPTAAPSSSTDINTQSVLEQYSLASCYVNKHPTVLDEKIKNELNDSWQDYATADPKNMGCDKYTAEQIETAAPLLKTDADADGVDLVTERFFGSNDNKKDSDGDTYDDYTEIIKGFNPNGAGELIEALPGL